MKKNILRIMLFVALVYITIIPKTEASEYITVGDFKYLLVDGQA